MKSPAAFFGSGTHSHSRSYASHPSTPNSDSAASIRSAPPATTFVTPAKPLFPFFSQLPKELRLQIWRAAAALPRVISLAKPPNNNPPITPRPKGEWIATARPPLTLATCHESRTETLANYTLCLAQQLGQPIYFSPASDVLMFEDLIGAMSFFSMKQRLDLAVKEECRLIRRMACFSMEKGGNDSFSLWVEERAVRNRTGIYENLELLVFVNLEQVHGEMPKVVLKKLRGDYGIVSEACVSLERHEGQMPAVAYVKCEENVGKPE